MWDLLHGQLSCSLVVECFCKGFTSLRVIPSPQTKSLLQISVFFFCLFEGMWQTIILLLCMIFM